MISSLLLLDLVGLDSHGSVSDNGSLLQEPRQLLIAEHLQVLSEDRHLRFSRLLWTLHHLLSRHLLLKGVDLCFISSGLILKDSFLTDDNLSIFEEAPLLGEGFVKQLLSALKRALLLRNHVNFRLLVNRLIGLDWLIGLVVLEELVHHFVLSLGHHDILVLDTVVHVLDNLQGKDIRGVVLGMIY